MNPASDVSFLLYSRLVGHQDRTRCSIVSVHYARVIDTTTWIHGMLWLSKNKEDVSWCFTIVPMSKAGFEMLSWHLHPWQKRKGKSHVERDISNHINTHLLFPAGCDGFCDFSTSPIMRSKAFATLKSRKALASVKAQLTSSANCRPSSRETWRWSGLRSLLFPTTTRGTSSAPWKWSVSHVEMWNHRSCHDLQGGWESYLWSSAPSRTTGAMSLSKWWCTRGFQWSAWSSRCCIRPVGWSTRQFNMAYCRSALAAYLSCSVDDLSRIVLSIVLDDPTEGVLDCRVIALDEVVFDKADCKRWFA